METTNNIEQLKENIREYIRQNGNKEITGQILQEVLLGMVDEYPDIAPLVLALANKVDKVEGKGLSTNDFTTALKNKLSNMPTITGFNEQTNHITIEGKEYELTPYVPIPDYYVGWTSGNAASFQAKTPQELVNGAGNNHFMVDTNPTYQHACINKIFYLLFKTDKAPTGGSLVSGGLESQISASDFLSGGIIHHEPITYDGTTYNVYTYADDDLISDSNIITVNFQ